MATESPVLPEPVCRLMDATTTMLNTMGDPLTYLDSRMRANAALADLRGFRRADWMRTKEDDDAGADE